MGEHEGYVILKKAAELTGYTKEHLRRLFLRGGISGIHFEGMLYISQSDVDEMTLPQHYIPVADAVEALGCTQDYLLRMVKLGKMPGKKHRQRVFVSGDYVESMHLPDGYVATAVAAEESGYSQDHINWLAKDRRIGSAMRFGRQFVSLSDIENYAQVPEGFVTIKEGHLRSGYSESHLKALSRNGIIWSIMKRSAHHIYTADLDYYSAHPSIHSIGHPIRLSGEMRELVIKLYDELVLKFDSFDDLTLEIVERMNGHRNGTMPSDVKSVLDSISRILQ